MTNPRNADETIQASLGRRAPYTQVGEWITFSGISPSAKELYTILAAHINYQRSDREVWPSKATLAEIMGLKQARAIDSYIKELIDLGAVDVQKRRNPNGLQARNHYTIHEAPPTDYDGPQSLKEFYEKRRPQPVDNHKTPGGPVVRSTAPRSALQRTSVVRSTAPELDEGFELEMKTLPPLGPVTAEAEPTGEGGGPDESAPSDEARYVVDELPPVGGRRVDNRRALAELLDAKVGQGWTLTQLQKELTRDLGSAESPGVYFRRLEALEAPLMAKRAPKPAFRLEPLPAPVPFTPPQHCKPHDRVIYNCRKCKPLKGATT